jgi:type IV pili sensor histidine kinase/response regulator
LVELSPEAEQQDPLQQIVDVTIPPTLAATVGDALRYVPLRSGFQLCYGPEFRHLDELPLPAADFRLGPLTLESALRILIGPGWNLEVDEITRKICFTPLSAPSPAHGLT